MGGAYSFDVLVPCDELLCACSGLWCAIGSGTCGAGGGRHLNSFVAGNAGELSTSLVVEKAFYETSSLGMKAGIKSRGIARQRLLAPS